MTTPPFRTRRQLPPYVHRLVEEAGRDDVFWTTARDPGQRPALGANINRLVNRVPGSSLEATQSTASAQPIWRGDRIEFAGDDLLNLANNLQAKGFTSIVVCDPGSGSVDVYGTESSTTKVAARWSGEPSLFVRSQDEAGNGNSAWGTHCGSGLQRCVSVLTGSTTAGEAYHVSIGATDGLETSSISFTSSSSWHLDGFEIGDTGGTVAGYEGDAEEFLLATSFVEQSRAEAIAEAIAARWRI